MNAPLLVAAGLCGLNLWTFAVFGYDKAQSRRGGGRVPEKHLLTLSALGGSPGALLARRLFRHKTRKQPFVNYLKTIVVLQCAGVVGLAVLAAKWGGAAGVF
ncbi:uncharacterized membrane protein YsdA (DUF1294 family) [Novosphingobium sp. PhB165]|uniref:DUF1294 domain-containing protein n=1 Tax=Novosphingobium sp. PhB165 TaxID=2485105 RepID=UPI001053802D|nr:DUF1294 domain-containing protein [Novosphingobium sp. PhB165]TCM18054.1 uncharacterized membrane protein YsdA (DUF1294 family) [Novosphingobium sp. PhB165]